MPHVFVWRSPKRSKMSSSAVYVPHTKYMWRSTWPGWLGSGSSRPTACTPGLHTQHAAPGTSRGGLCRRGCPTKPYFSRRPRGGPHIFYMADELILERFGLRHTNTWGTHHVIWLTNECIFFKIARGGKSTLKSDGRWGDGRWAFLAPFEVWGETDPILFFAYFRG